MLGPELLRRKMKHRMTLFRVWQFPDLIDEVTNQKLTRPGHAAVVP
jgi:hypothetical protein